MASYSLLWKRSARKELRKLPRDARRRILAAVERLIDEPYPPGSRKLIGSQGAFRLRVGNYRIVYSVFTSELLIEVVRVGDRKNVYR